MFTPGDLPDDRDDNNEPSATPDPAEESMFRSLATGAGDLGGQSWDDWLKRDLRATFGTTDRRMNLIVAGRTGVGKSALVNTIFGRIVAEEGTGLPVTESITKHPAEDIPVTIWDTVGLTVGVDIDAALADLQKVINSTRLQAESEHIHLALYCINARSQRVLPEELDLIRKLAVDVPVLVVLTQCLGRRDAQAEALAVVLREAALPLGHPVIFKILARPVEIDEDVSVPPFGVPELVRVMADLLPSAARSAFVASQRLVLDVKVMAAKKIVVAAAAGAGAIGLSPIPLIDAPGIAAVQFAMINRISAVMGLRQSTVSSALKASGLLGMLTSFLIGRTAARALRRLIPIAGNAINGGTASHSTYTLGTQYIKLCAMLLERFPSGDVPTEVLQEAIRTLLDRRAAE
jgi:uncharacterized protein (DUF697 family)/predicted GTPase